MLEHALHRRNSAGYALHLQSLSDDAFCAVLGCAMLLADALKFFVPYNVERLRSVDI